MAENKNSFIIYTDWKQDFEFLTNEEAGKLIKHLLQFASDENPTLENEDRLLQFAAQKMKAVMKKDLKKYESVVKQRIEAGKKGGLNSGKSRASKQNEANEANASTSKQNEHVNVNDNVNDNVNNSNKEKVEKENGAEAPTPQSKSFNFKKCTKEEFSREVGKYVEEYGRDMCNHFHRYWVEPDAHGKMKFQLKKTWSTRGRLTSWKNNESKYGSTKPQPQPVNQGQVFRGPFDV